MTMSQADIPPELLQLLLEQARGGDGKALGRLLDQYRNFLKLRARSCVGPNLRVRLDYSDLVQDTFVSACLGFTDFRGHKLAEFVTWLLRIQWTLLANHIKRNRAARRDLRCEESLEALEWDPADPGSSPSTQAARRERDVRLSDALKELTPGQREVVILRLVYQVPVPEIAERMGKTTGAVAELWARATKRLYAILKEQP
jgi:RNA polymerase sigma-70 factor, ECF subfamily